MEAQYAQTTQERRQGIMENPAPRGKSYMGAPVCRLAGQTPTGATLGRLPGSWTPALSVALTTLCACSLLSHAQLFVTT